MTTDYRAAHDTVSQALALIDDNQDFDDARDTDAQWPGHLQGAAVRALRELRDRLGALI